MAELPIRLSYEASCKRLQDMKWLEAGEVPPMPPQRPAYDDEEPLGVNFFRTRVADDDMSNLNLSRTFLVVLTFKTCCFGIRISRSRHSAGTILQMSILRMRL